MVLIGVISAIVAPPVEREKASEPGSRQQQNTEIENPNETVVFDHKTVATVTGQVRPIESPKETVVFDHSQGRGDLFYAYVPEESVGNDSVIYAIAVREYQDRDEEEVTGNFYSDLDEAKNASCYEEPNSSGFSAPCDGVAHQYLSHRATVILSKGLRQVVRHSASPVGITDEVESWKVSLNAAPTYEVAFVDKLSASNLINTYVVVSDEIAASDSSLCAIAYAEYQDQEKLANTVQVRFLTEYGPKLKRARDGDLTAKSELVKEAVASISIAPGPSYGKPNRSFWRSGTWDENAPVPTCDPLQQAPGLPTEPYPDPLPTPKSNLATTSEATNEEFNQEASLHPTTQSNDSFVVSEHPSERVVEVCQAIRSLYESRIQRFPKELSAEEELNWKAIKRYVGGTYVGGSGPSDELYQRILEGRTSAYFWLIPSTYAPPYEHCASMRVIPTLVPTPTPTPFVVSNVTGDVFAEEVCRGYYDWLRRTIDFRDESSPVLSLGPIVNDPFHWVLLDLGRQPLQESWDEAEREVHAGAVEMWEHSKRFAAIEEIPRWAKLYQTCKDRYGIDPFAGFYSSSK